MAIASLILAAIGLWLFLEGAAYAVAPDTMRRMAAFLAQQPSRDLAFAGLGSAVFGAIVLIVAVRLL